MFSAVYATSPPKGGGRCCRGERYASSSTEELEDDECNGRGFRLRLCERNVLVGGVPSLFVETNAAAVVVVADPVRKRSAATTTINAVVDVRDIISRLSLIYLRILIDVCLFSSFLPPKILSNQK